MQCHNIVSMTPNDNRKKVESVTDFKWKFYKTNNSLLDATIFFHFPKC